MGWTQGMHVTGLVFAQGGKKKKVVVGDNQIPFGHSLTLWVSKLVLKRSVSAASCLVCMCLRRLWHSLKI